MAWKEQTGEAIIFWKPKTKGDQIEGTVTKIDTEGNYGLQVDIKTSSGDLYRTPAHKVLQNRLYNVHKGDKLRITYQGEEEGKKGMNPVQIYKVELEV